MGVEKAHVAGHSLGSMIAQALAAEHPRRVRKLVLLGSTGAAPLTRGDYLWSRVSSMTAPVAGNTAFLKEWSPTQSPTPVDPLLARWIDREIAEVPLHVWHAVVRELVGVPIARHSADIQAPTLIVSAEKDALFDRSHHDALARAIPHARSLIVPEVGHNLILERSQVIGPAILNFLASPDPGQAAAR